MAMIQAKCENCGAVLSIDSDRMISFCSYCGSKYILDDSVNYNNTYTKVEHMYADVVQVNDENSAEGRLNAADAYMKMGKFDKAEFEYRKVTEMTPQNYRGWLGLIESRTHNYTDNYQTDEDMNILEDWSKSLCAVVPEGNGKELLARYRVLYAKKIKNENNEIDYYINALNAQGNKLIDLLEQDKSLQNSLDECEKAISIIKGKSYAFYNVIHVKGILGLFICAFLLFGGIFALAMEPSVFKVIGIESILISIVEPFVLIVEIISAWEEKKKVDKILTAKASERVDLLNKLSSLRKQALAMSKGINSNKDHLESARQKVQLLINRATFKGDYLSEYNKQKEQIDKLYSELETRWSALNSQPVRTKTPIKAVASSPITTIVKIKRMVSIIMLSLSVFWIGSYIGTDVLYIPWLLVTHIMLIIVGVLISPLLSSKLSKVKSLKILTDHKKMWIAIPAILCCVILFITLIISIIKPSDKASKNIADHTNNVQVESVDKTETTVIK